METKLVDNQNLDVGSMKIEELAKMFQTHLDYFEKWIANLGITNEDIEYALKNFSKRQRFSLVVDNLKPLRYLVDYPFLLSNVHAMNVEDIKRLKPSVFSEHHGQLRFADDLWNTKNNRALPYQQYNAEAFYVLRHTSLKADIKFVQKLFRRSISHHTYPKAKEKLRFLVSKLS